MGWSVIAIVAIAVAVAAAVPAPSRRRLPGRRWPADARPGEQAPPTSRHPARFLVRRLRGRPDALAPRLRWGSAVVVAAVATVTGMAAGWAPAAVLPVAGLLGAVLWVVLGQIEPDHLRRRRRRLVQDLPEVCHHLAACLAAGLPLRGAAAGVAAAMGGPAADDLRRVEALIAVGEPEPEAWRSLRQDPAWRELAVDLARAVESGMPLGPTLALHARQATASARLARERRARTAGVRSVVPMMVCFLPAFFLIGVVPIVAGLVLAVLR